jgi:hypothetical protein
VDGLGEGAPQLGRDVLEQLRVLSILSCNYVLLLQID